MVVDAAGCELEHGRLRVDREADERDSGPAPGRPICPPRKEKQQSEQHDERPQGTRGNLGVGSRQNVGGDIEHRHKRRVDDPRPVGNQSLGTTQLRKCAVEPGGARDQIADLNDPGSIIGVAEGGDEMARIRPEVHQGHGHDADQAPEKEWQTREPAKIDEVVLSPRCGNRCHPGPHKL